MAAEHEPDRFERHVHASERRKQRARDRGNGLIGWLGTSGLVGWSIALPTLAGAGLGMWLDRRYVQRFSWTLTLMFVGLVLGCALAWFWVRRESRG